MCADFFRCNCTYTADLVRKHFVITYCKPIEAGIGCSIFQHSMKLLNKCLAGSIGGAVNNHINAFEVIGRLYHIIYFHSLIRYADGIRLKDISCLVMGESAAFNVVGIIG